MRRALWLLILGAGCGDDGAGPQPDAAITTQTPDGSAAAPDAGDGGSRMDAAMPTATDAQADAITPADTGPATDAGGEDASVQFPDNLAETGLYANGSVTTLGDSVMAFEPDTILWSDTATKRRWFYLPPGSRIDTSDMDYWVFPVGTKAWKEFTRDGTRVETRLIWNTREGFFMMAFAWNAAQTEALAVPSGVNNAMGTDHDIPEGGDCRDCHDGQPGRLLGLSAIQLSHNRGATTLQTLIDNDMLSDPPTAPFSLPDTDGWNALKYLHANCGNCHNPNGLAFDRAPMQLWLTTSSLGAVTTTPSHLTTVDVVPNDAVAGYSRIINPGYPDDSVLIHRMETARTDTLAMPPIAVEMVDTAAVTLLRTWVTSL